MTRTEGRKDKRKVSPEFVNQSDEMQEEQLLAREQPQASRLITSGSVVSSTRKASASNVLSAGEMKTGATSLSVSLLWSRDFRRA